MSFCPSCANILLVDKTSSGLQLFCRTCPYISRVTRTVTRSLTFKRKQVDDVMGAEAWADADQIEAVCPECSCKSAYFKQIQIRSADEPMTIFYKCVGCGHRWHDK
jgi:DNA-directed RNA polymerase III subunit RPC11